jgi:uncharacterized protein
MDEKMVYLRPPMWLPVLVALVAGGMYVAGKYVETRDQSIPTISVQGEGKVLANPDIALLTFGVQTGRTRTAQAAMETLAKQMNAIIDSVKAAGVESKDINTQYLSLNPSYDYREGTRVDQGFEANQNLQVKVRDLSKISDVLDAAVSKGANNVGGVSFTIDDPEELRGQAREQAIADAQQKAEKLAADLGHPLGKFLGFSENGGYPMPQYEMRMTMDSAMGVGGATPSFAPQIPAGEQEIIVTVFLTYQLR